MPLGVGGSSEKHDAVMKTMELPADVYRNNDSICDLIIEDRMNVK